MHQEHFASVVRSYYSLLNVIQEDSLETAIGPHLSKMPKKSNETKNYVPKLQALLFPICRLPFIVHAFACSVV